MLLSCVINCIEIQITLLRSVELLEKMKKYEEAVQLLENLLETDFLHKYRQADLIFFNVLSRVADPGVKPHSHPNLEKTAGFDRKKKNLDPTRSRFETLVLRPENND